MVTVLVLPQIELIEDTDNPQTDKSGNISYHDKHFPRVWDKVKNVIKVKYLNEPTDQICLEKDGAHNYQCNPETGENIRNPKKKFMMDMKTGFVCTDPNNPDRREVDEYVEKGTVDFILTEESGITQEDIDIEKNKCCLSLGCGMTNGMRFNGKRCCILVLQDGHGITQAKINQIIQECKAIT